MKKQWSNPTISELKINNTEYDPNGGKIEDGMYQSIDGKYTFPTYGTSKGNSGTPETSVKA